MEQAAEIRDRRTPPEGHGGDLLDVRGVSLDFVTPRGRLHALRNVNFSMPEGRIVGVVGESGSGKSTLAYAVSGLLSENATITDGSIMFQGRNVLDMTPEERRGLRGAAISMIFQDPMTSLNPVRSVGQQMTDIQFRDRISRRQKRERAVEMLGKVGIPDPAGRLGAYPHEFSGGMRQRICIAMALLVNPALLIADEPTTALDATLEVQIIELLRDLQKDIGCSVLFVSHHLGAIAELCEDVVVMYAGEVVERGTVREIFHHAGHPYTQALLACDPGRIEERTRELPTIPGEIPDLVSVPSGCIYKTRCRYAFDRCDREYPLSRVMSPTHGARCHLLDDSRSVDG